MFKKVFRKYKRYKEQRFEAAKLPSYVADLL